MSDELEPIPANFASPPPTTRLPAGVSAFRHHNFRLFWGGMAISLVGTWMQSVAQAWLVLEKTNDPLALGLVAAAQFTPALVLGLLVVFNVVEVWHVFVIALLLGVVSSLDMPIRQSFVVEMVGMRDIANAVALNSSVFNLTRIIGPAIAGVTIATIGLEPLFFANAISYLAVVASIFLMRPAAKRGLLIVVPTTVVMEAFAGARSPARLNQVLKAIDVELPLVPAISHQVHVLLRRAGTGSETDAIVVLEAIQVPPSAVLTDDPDDIHALIEAAGVHGRIPVLTVTRQTAVRWPR